MSTSLGWLAPVVLVGLWVVCFVWTAITAPGFRVKDQHVLITGATKGLGLALAKRYAKAGARLTLVGRSMERLQAARAAVETATKETVAIYVHTVDLTVAEAVDAMVAAANEFHGRPTDHIVCAASASTVRGFIVDASVDAIRSVMDLNYFAAVTVVKAALPAMVDAEVRGRVVLVCSSEALSTPADSVLVSGAAFAIKGLGEVLRNECKLYGIRTHVLYTGGYVGPYRTLAADSSAPTTPGQDRSVVATDYATFDATVTEDATRHADALASTLISGMKSGHVSITASGSGFMLRTLSNGVVPRFNSMFELMVTPLLIAGMGVANLFTQTPPLAHKEAAGVRVANAYTIPSV